MIWNSMIMKVPFVRHTSTTTLQFICTLDLLIKWLDNNQYIKFKGSPDHFIHLVIATQVDIKVHLLPINNRVAIAH